MRELKDYTIGTDTVQAGSLAEAKRIIKKMKAFEKKQEGAKSEKKVTAKVKKVGNCWYLQNDFISQLPHRIQSESEVEKWLMKRAMKLYPGQKILLDITFLKASHFDKECEMGGR
jgi:hypothetical protein